MNGVIAVLATGIQRHFQAPPAESRAGCWSGAAFSALAMILIWPFCGPKLAPVLAAAVPKLLSFVVNKIAIACVGAEEDIDPVSDRMVQLSASSEDSGIVGACRAVAVQRQIAIENRYEYSRFAGGKVDVAIAAECRFEIRIDPSAGSRLSAFNFSRYA